MHMNKQIKIDRKQNFSRATITIGTLFIKHAKLKVIYYCNIILFTHNINIIIIQ